MFVVRCADCVLSSAIFFGLFTAGMAGTSLELAANNLTQVEKLGGKTKVHLLAILKPPPSEVPPETPLVGPEVSYREITYPLSTKVEQNLQEPNHLPISTANSNASIPQIVGKRQNRQSFGEHGDLSSPHLRQHSLPAETTETSKRSVIIPEGRVQDTAQLGSRIIPEQDIPTKLYQTPDPGELFAGTSPGLTQGTQDTISSAGGAAQQHNSPSQQNERPREIPRDSKATRTFAILKMLNPGDNPWDLGSARLNLETVMGNGVVDWLLPIRRSPCCDHEDAESQFRVGPKVDILRASYYLAEPNDERLPKQIWKASELIESAKNQPARDPSLTGPSALPMSRLP